MDQLVGFAPLILLVVLFWAIAMRPARKQRENVAKMQRELAIGDEIVTTAGIFGTVHQLAETRLGLEVAPGVVIEMARQAVVRKVDPAELAAEPDDEDGTPDEAESE